MSAGCWSTWSVKAISVTPAATAASQDASIGVAQSTEKVVWTW
jgi:hypothetical protein